MNPPIITPETFKSAADSVFNEIGRRLFLRWEYNNSYFNAWNDELDGFYPKVRDILKLKYRWNYYNTVAAAYYAEECLHAPLCNEKPRAKFLSLIIQHVLSENRSLVDMNELTAFNAPLKVLITYPVEKSESEMKKCYAEQISAADAVFPGLSKRQKYLVIFVYANEVKEILAYGCHLYKNGEFVKL